MVFYDDRRKTTNEVKMWKDKLIAEFGENIINPWCSLRDGGEDIIKECMTEKPVSVAVEVGTFRGVATHYMAQFADVVHTIDVREQPETGKIKDFMNNSNVKYYLIDERRDKEDKEKICQSLDNIDFVFIDGSHGRGVFDDMEIFKKCCNRLLFHDYKNGFGFPDQAVAELVRQGWKLQEFHQFAYCTRPQ